MPLLLKHVKCSSFKITFSDTVTFFSMCSQSWNLWSFNVDSAEFVKIQTQQIMTASQSNNRYFGCKCLKEYSLSFSTITMEELSVRSMFSYFSTHSSVYCQYTYTISSVYYQYTYTISSVYCQYSYRIRQADSFALPEQDATLSNNLLGLAILNNRCFQFCVSLKSIWTVTATQKHITPSQLQTALYTLYTLHTFYLYPLQILHKI
jgi:hypothetical protein